MMILILLASLAGIASVVCDVDWCNPKYCPSKQNHIACNHAHTKSASCPNDFRIVPFTQNLKDMAVNEHNRLRNQQALGQTPMFGPAKRMASMTWDNKLAEFAELNVMQCKMEHDSCRSTEQFYFAGQNLAISTVIDDEKFIMQTITDWFDESNFTTMNDIRNFTDGVNAAGKMIGHFTQVVRDEAYKIGCAMSRFYYAEYDMPSSLMACNYAVTNILNFPVYEEGDTASGCKMGTHPNYPGLCSESEVYDGQFFHKMNAELSLRFDADSAELSIE